MNVRRLPEMTGGLRTGMSSSLLAPVLLGLAFVCLQLVDISTYPMVTADEAFYSDPAFQLVSRFSFRNDVLSGNLGFDGPYFWQPPGYAFLQALIYAIAGFGIWQTRLAGIVFGGAACIALYKLIELLTGNRRVAFVAGSLPMFWPAFLLTAKSSRMDTHAIFFLLLATNFAIRSLEPRASRIFSIACGACIGIMGVIHSAGITWAIGLVLGLALQTWRTPKNLVLLAAAAAALPAAWLVAGAIHVDAFKGQFLYHLANRSAAGSLVERLVGEFGRYQTELTRVPLVIPVLVFVAVIGFRSLPASRPFRVVLTMTTTAFVLNLFAAGKSFGFYQLYTISCLIVFCAMIWANALEALSPAKRRLGAVLLGAMIVNMAAVAYAPRAAALVWQGPQRDYWLQFKELTSRLQPGDQLWGTAVAWYAAVSAGARLDAHSQAVPVRWASAPDPMRHRFLVFLKDEGVGREVDGYRKLGTFGEPVPRILGSALTNASYVYDLWISTKLPDNAAAGRKN
jgi:4-amino-4-deoxy-L-arabinose transferase-like glycosyltransferase